MKTSPITDLEKSLFNVLRLATKADSLACVRTTDKTGKEVAVLVACSEQEGGAVQMIPLAVLLDQATLDSLNTPDDTTSTPTKLNEMLS